MIEMESCVMEVGDVRDALPVSLDRQFDACLTDPPYGIQFAGEDWDSKVPQPAYWRGILESLKPGGYLLAFCGTRSWHRLGYAIEQAGFEIRDHLLWMYGEGMAHSHSIADGLGDSEGVDQEEWRGRGTNLKPAYEPVVVAMKPREGSFADNVKAYGVAGLNIDGCRIPTEDSLSGGAADGNIQLKDKWSRPWMEDDEALEAYAERTRQRVERAENLGRWPANVVLSKEAADLLDRSVQDDVSRFFYTPKASSAEREAGLFDNLDGRTNTHPTLKPVALTTWLATLVLPPPGRNRERFGPSRLLVPFSGVASEVIGGMLAGWDRIMGIEQNAEYVDIAGRRVDWWAEHGSKAIDRYKQERNRRQRNDQTGQTDLVDDFL